MLNNKNVLINGCSFSRGPGSWPYYLAEMCKFNLVNLAQASAGNTYIHESTVEELSKRSYDFVIIMWSGLQRLDFLVENIELFSESKYHSQYQKIQNDWPEKVIFPVNDQDFVNDNWVFGNGYINRDPAIVGSGLFTGIYRLLSYDQLVYHSLQRMISLQSFLKAKDIDYLFTFYMDYDSDLQKFDSLYNLLDQTKIYREKIINTMATQKQQIDETYHPLPEIHNEWAILLKEHLDAQTA